MVLVHAILGVLEFLAIGYEKERILCLRNAKRLAHEMDHNRGDGIDNVLAPSVGVVNDMGSQHKSPGENMEMSSCFIAVVISSSKFFGPSFARVELDDG